MVRITLDSNIYVSALQYGGVGARLLTMARSGAVRIDTSAAILEETIGVLRDKFAWDGYRLHFARAELRKLANVVVPSETLQIAEDPDDNRIIECAIAAGSEYIVTNDKDLLRLAEYRGISIIRPAEFLQRGIAPRRL